MTYSILARSSIIKNAYHRYYERELASKRTAMQNLHHVINAPTPVSTLRSNRCISLVPRCSTPALEESTDNKTIEKAQEILRECGYKINSN